METRRSRRTSSYNKKNIQANNKSRISNGNIEILQLSFNNLSSDSFIDRKSTCSPNTLHKVNNWIKSINVHKNCKRYNNFSFMDMSKDLLINNNGDKEYEEELMLKNEQNKYRTTDTTYQQLYGNSLQKFSYPLAVKRRKTTFKSQERNSVGPLSPNSEKKKELCNYLQLMKPTDKKDVETLTNRRSTRVKNFTLMQEKKDLETKLMHNDESVEFNFPKPSKVLEEAISNFDEIDLKTLDNNNDDDEYSLPQLPEEFNENIKDFEESIHDFFTEDELKTTNSNNSTIRSQSQQISDDESSKIRNTFKIKLFSNEKKILKNPSSLLGNAAINNPVKNKEPEVITKNEIPEQSEQFPTMSKEEILEFHYSNKKNAEKITDIAEKPSYISKILNIKSSSVCDDVDGDEENIKSSCSTKSDFLDDLKSSKATKELTNNNLSKTPSCILLKEDESSIEVQSENGQIIKVFYIEYNLIICQELSISFWIQPALGHVLGAQNMWINRGNCARLGMNNNYILKDASSMICCCLNKNLAYIELWSKEHQSEKREAPVADIFVTIYYWKDGQNELKKKNLQLENIKGFADDVQYSVLKSSAQIVVSWHISAASPLDQNKTFIHSYQLDADFQSIEKTNEFEFVQHYVSSLHNIDGCDTLIMGCGDNKITLWNVPTGYIALTLEMTEIPSPLSTFWVKCDRGFLFTLQQCVNKELRLIAINGIDHSWEKLASYIPPAKCDRLKGVYVENGLIVACYDQRIICWNARTSEILLESAENRTEFLSGSYIISIQNNRVSLRHAISRLISL